MSNEQSKCVPRDTTAEMLGAMITKYKAGEGWAAMWEAAYHAAPPCECEGDLDAARYRWLRQNPTFFGWEHDFAPERIDAEVDRERTKPRED